jgi:catechol 2,3-dioxygenase-like lactoylglutathione lyase family enzyme
VLRDYGLIAFVATLDASRARRFYEGVLGLDFVEDTPFALIFDANGTTLRIQKVAELKPASYTVLGWRVPDIRTAIETLTARGVKFERYEGMAQDELGVWTSQSGCKIAWFKDPDGNLASLTKAVTE